MGLISVRDFLTSLYEGVLCVLLIHDEEALSGARFSRKFGFHCLKKIFDSKYPFQILICRLKLCLIQSITAAKENEFLFVHISVGKPNCATEYIYFTGSFPLSVTGYPFNEYLYLYLCLSHG